MFCRTGRPLGLPLFLFILLPFESTFTFSGIVSYLLGLNARMRFRKRSHNSYTDEELIARYKETEDPEWVGYLFDRYAQLVFLVSMKYLKDTAESEDAAMQVFEKLLFDLKRYEVRIFKGWLHMVVRNHCLMLLEQRKRKHRQVEEIKYESDVMETHSEFDLMSEPSEEEITLLRMQKALEQLNDQQRYCLDLFYLQKKSYQEVADISGFTLKQVKSYIQNGKRNLKIMLSENNPDA